MYSDQLPQSVLDHAYDKDDPPQGIMIDRLKLVAENHVPLGKSSLLLRNEEDEENKLRESIAGPNNGGQLIPQLLKGITSYFNTVDGAHLTVEPPPRTHNAKAFSFIEACLFEVFQMEFST